jgi:hypothetical protein
MPVRQLALADPEVAAAVFKAHLDRLWDGGRPDRLGWIRSDVDPLHTVVALPATRPDGMRDTYYFRLGAEYYDAAPPTVSLVEPDGVTHPPQASRWFPRLQNPPWFGLAAEYYMTDHSPTESQEWRQGRHTVAATLFRLGEILSPAHYQGPGA